MSTPTIYEALRAKLRREPTHRELCDDVKRILAEGQWKEYKRNIGAPANAVQRRRDAEKRTHGHD